MELDSNLLNVTPAVCKPYDGGDKYGRISHVMYSKTFKHLLLNMSLGRVRYLGQLE